MNQSEKRIYLIQELLKESDEYNRITIPQKTEDQKLLLRGLMNIRPPRRTNADFQKIQDSYLIEETMKKVLKTGRISTNPTRNLCMAGRYHNSAVRRDRKCGQQWNDRMLCSEPSLYRQLHPYICRHTASFGLRRNNAQTGT